MSGGAAWRRRGGFTIIELLVTVALVSIMASAAIPAGELIVQRARERELREVLRAMRAAIDEYKKASDQGRIAMAVGESGYPRQLGDLLGARDQKDPNGATLRFLRRLPRNPLNADLAVPAQQTWGLRSYASEHAHPQPGRDVFDVYPLTQGKGINGVPYKQW
ncbi:MULTISPECIES: type II secretion system protein [unclassified Janthinobacterium]|uniref:type II secretion system protein n=1 Tax=unclassified Janthinobacterium TaxID=2610881 RepID=UPI00034B04D2|nr:MULTISPECIES: type II secretion system protein [unclassified Janthinobacterium]MEC5159550.1 general secretion pathway protein G [Janthinobacterium sp. CG_S6]